MTDVPPPAPTVTITLSRKEAEGISYDIADLLCWHRGFSAARSGTELNDDAPMGVDAARKISLKIKDALK